MMCVRAVFYPDAISDQTALEKERFLIMVSKFRILKKLNLQERYLIPVH